MKGREKNHRRSKTLFHWPEQDYREESELGVSNARLRFLFDNMKSGVAVYRAINKGEDFIFVDFNRSAEQIEGIKKENLIGRSVLEVFPGVKEFGLFDVLRRVWKTGQSEHHPVSIYRDEKGVSWRDNYVYRLPSGEIIAVYEDVTERKRSELALRMSEQRFRAIADYTYDWESWVSPGGNLLWVNPAVERISGYSVAECMKMTTTNSMMMVYEQDREKIAAVLEYARKNVGSRGEGVEFRIRRKDDAIIWVEMSWQSIFDNKGVCQGYRSSVRDITARKLAENALRASEEKYRALVENIDIGIALIDADHNIVMANSATGRLFGRPVYELIGKKCYERFGKGGTVHKYCPGEEAMRTGRRETVETEAVHEDGSRFAVRINSFPVFAEDGTAIAFIELIEDITEEKIAQEKLQESQEQYQAFIENFHGIAFRGKLDFTPVFFHGAVETITGYTEQEFIAAKPRWDQIICPDDLHIVYYGQSAKLRTTPGFLLSREYRIVRKDGQIRWVHETIQNLCDKDGKITLVQGAIYDITDRKEAEERILSLARFPSENPFPVLRIAKDGTILYSNRAGSVFLNAWGIQVGQPAPEKWAKLAQETLASGNRQIEEIQLDDRTFSLTLAPITGEGYVNVYGIDITERKRAEASIKQEMEFRDSIIQNAEDGICVCQEIDAPPGIFFNVWNPHMTDITGYTVEEINKLGWYQTVYTDKETQDLAADRMQRMRSGENLASEEWVITRKDGTKRTLLISTCILPLAPGSKPNVLAIMHDITELK
jgi:PAS domain S-box-containing protein